MTLPHTPQKTEAAHADAIERVDAAHEEEHRAMERSDAAEGTSAELNAAVDLAAAREHSAARRAWVGYIEQGH